MVERKWRVARADFETLTELPKLQKKKEDAVTDRDRLDACCVIVLTLGAPILVQPDVSSDRAPPPARTSRGDRAKATF